MDTEDTEETDTDETDDTDEFADSAFPELLADFSDRVAEAMPFPLVGDEDPENLTPSVLLVVGFGPMLELQMILDSSPEAVTCPEIQGEFPEDGLPTEDIIVTGNGCTNEFGTTYEGSFIYGPNGLTYGIYRSS